MTRRKRRQPTAAERAQRREQLLDAVETALRNDGPSASMEAMAAAAGVTKPILYKHFGSKDGLADALAQRWVDQLGASLENALTTTDDPHRQLGSTIDAYLELISEHPEIYRFLLEDTRGGAGRRVEDFVSQLTLRLTFVLAVHFGRLGVGVERAELAANALVGMVRQAGDWWLAHPGATDREALAEQLTTLGWRGLAGLPTAAAADPLAAASS